METQTPPVETPEQFREEFKQQWMQARLAHEGLMLEEVQRRNRDTHALARFAASGDANQLVEDTRPQPSEADVGVSIGNKHYHWHNESKPVNETQTSTTLTAAARTAGSLGKAALIAAALGGGPLTAVVMSYLNRPSTTIVEPPPIVQDVEYESGFVPLDK